MADADAERLHPQRVGATGNNQGTEPAVRPLPPGVRLGGSATVPVVVLSGPRKAAIVRRISRTVELAAVALRMQFRPWQRGDTRNRIAQRQAADWLEAVVAEALATAIRKVAVMTCTPTCVWPTPSQAHCGRCHVTFSGPSLFDAHRMGGVCNPITDAEPGLPYDQVIVAGKVRTPVRLDPRGVWRYDVARTNVPSTNRDTHTD